MAIFINLSLSLDTESFGGRPFGFLVVLHLSLFSTFGQLNDQLYPHLRILGSMSVLQSVKPDLSNVYIIIL